MPNGNKKPRISVPFEEQYARVISKPEVPEAQKAIIAPITWEDRLRNANILGLTLPDIIRGSTVGVGAVGGSTFGPGGTILGGMAGDLAYQLSQKFAPRIFGTAPEGMVAPFKTAAQNVLLNELAGPVISKVAGGLSPGVGSLASQDIRESLKRSALGRLFPENPLKQEVSTAFRGMPEAEFNQFKPDIAQVTQSPLAYTLRDIFAPHEAFEKVAGQQAITRTARDKFLSAVAKRPVTVSEPVENIAQIATKSAARRYQFYKQSENQLWENFKSKAKINIENATQTVIDPVSKTAKVIPVQLRSPVKINTTTENAQRIINDIREEIGKQVYGLDQDSTNQLTKIFDRLSPYVNPPRNKAGEPVLDYFITNLDKQTLTTDIGTLAEKLPGDLRNRLLGATNAIRNSLGHDIMQSAQKDWPKDIGQSYIRANTKSINNISRFNNKIAQDIRATGLNDADIIKEDVLNRAISSTQEAKQLVRSVGGKEEGATFLVQNIFKSSTDANGNILGEKAIQQLTNKQDIANVFLTSDQRSQLKLLLRRVQAAPPELSMTGKVAVWIRGAGAVMGITGGLLSGIQTGNISTGVMTGTAILTGIKGVEKFTKDVILNPKYARLLAEGTTLKPSSQRAMQIMTTLFKGPLRGVQFQVQYGGQNKLMEAREDGRLHEVTMGVE